MHLHNRSLRQFFYFTFLQLLAISAITNQSLADEKTPKVKSANLGSTRNVHTCGSVLLAAQPGVKDLEAAKKQGVAVVITLRTAGEIDWDEAAKVKKLGMSFHQFGFRQPSTLKDSVFDNVRKVLNDSKGKKVLLHCGSANRVGAVWAAHRVLDHGLSVDEALKEAKTVGLNSEGYTKKVKDYIQRKQK